MFQSRRGEKSAWAQSGDNAPRKIVKKEFHVLE
jgi:hypothetical protein